MISILINGLIILGCSFVFIAAFGVFRLPDLYTRIHAATKAGAFGGVLIALAGGLAFMHWITWINVFLITGFFYLTMPVAGHLLARAAFMRKVNIYKKEE